MSAAACFHCGAGLRGDHPPTLVIDGARRRFCSEGCEHTAELIAARGLTEFYRFRDGPAATAKIGDTQVQRWQVFDRDGLQREFVSSGPDGLRTARLLLQGVRCAACTWLIESALGRVPGVHSISVDPLTTRASLSWDPARLPLSELLALLGRLGYTPVPCAEDAAEQAARAEERAALQRLVVAGLGMMQVMSFAVALYLGAWRDPQIESYLRLVSLLVSTPVVFYAGAPFFRGAWNGLRARVPGMDVPVALAIGGAWIASVWHTLSGAGEVYFDSATMFIFFLTAARYLEMRGRHRAVSLTAALASHLPRVATRFDAGTPTEVGVMELQIGNRVLVSPGQALPADGKLESPVARLDEALLTGEAEPVLRRQGDRLVAGSVNIEQSLEMCVTRVGADTVMAQIARLVGDAGARKPRLVQLADRVASWFVVAVLLAAALTGLVWWQLAPGRAFEVVLAVLVVTCPCALALAMPAAFTVATSCLARQGFMVRRAGALQELSRINDLVFDKTGTLTGGKPDISAVQVFRQAIGAEPLAIAAALESRSTHPLARAFPRPDPRLRISDVRQIAGAGLEGVIDGRRYRLGTPHFASSLAGPAAAAQAETVREEKQICLGDCAGLLARFTIREQPRADAPAVLAGLAAAGLGLHMFSGDQAGPVAALARQLGVRHWQAGMQPAQKLAAVRELQAAGQVVAMVGDGINDSPVLAGADVSVAMGSGTSLAQHSADCVLMSEKLGPLLTAVTVARRTMRIVRQNLAWAVAYNLVALPLAATGLLAPWMAALGMSASSLLVTGNALRLAKLPAQPRASLASPAPPVTKPCCKKAAGVVP